MLKRTVECIAAGTKVWTRQAVIGKTCTVRAASNRCNLRLIAKLPHDCLRIFDQVHARLDLLRHILILVSDRQHHRTFPVFLI